MAGETHKGTEASHWIVEGDVDLDSLGNHILNFLELMQLVSTGHIIMALDDHSGDEASQWLDGSQ